jgi:hypothetical protein
MRGNSVPIGSASDWIAMRRLTTSKAGNQMPPVYPIRFELTDDKSINPSLGVDYLFRIVTIGRGSATDQ